VTAQTPNSIEYQEHLYVIASKKGTELFEPQQHGLDPVSFSTADERGYYCCYAVRSSQLLLTKLGIGMVLEKGKQPPTLFGVTPHKETHDVYSRPLFAKEPRRTYSSRESPEWIYSDLEVQVPFTGRLFLGRHFIRELYTHVGFPTAWSFEEALELRIDDGAIIEVVERSQDMARIRERFNDETLTPGFQGFIEVMEWARLTLGLDFRGK